VFEVHWQNRLRELLLTNHYETNAVIGPPNNLLIDVVLSYAMVYLQNLVSFLKKGWDASTALLYFLRFSSRAHRKYIILEITKFLFY
jgi:hypothetical protein